MAFSKKTIRDVDLGGKSVLVRADYNVPLQEGRITDDYRIKQSLPTLQYLIEQKAKIVIISHLGRPDGKANPAFSLKPVAVRLGQLLGQKVEFVGDCVGDKVKQAADHLAPGGVLLLENLRFHAEEEKDSVEFAKALVSDSGAQVFVQDGFGVVHRAHASTYAVAKQIPAVAGLLLEKEVINIATVMEEPKRPLVALVGGAKISDKIDILNRLINIADTVCVGGAMANNFLAIQDLPVGASLVEKAALSQTKTILAKAKKAEKKRNFNFLLPVDAVVSQAKDGTKPTRIVDLTSFTLADIEAYPKKPALRQHQVLANEMILDIGPLSAQLFAGAIKTAQTVIWNGTCGVTEVKGIAGAARPFAHGTNVVALAMIGPSNRHANKPFTLVGGGDTVGYVEQEGLIEDFSHVSTGGGASLELMSGRQLPGMEVLGNKAG